MVALGLPRRAYTSPTPRQAGISEQIGLDRHRIKAGHVFLDVRPLDIEVVGLSDHADMIVLLRFPVQQEF